MPGPVFQIMSFCAPLLSAIALPLISTIRRPAGAFRRRLDSVHHFSSRSTPPFCFRALLDLPGDREVDISDGNRRNLLNVAHNIPPLQLKIAAASGGRFAEPRLDFNHCISQRLDDLSHLGVLINVSLPIGLRLPMRRTASSALFVRFSANSRNLACFLSSALIYAAPKFNPRRIYFRPLCSFSQLILKIF